MNKILLGVAAVLALTTTVGAATAVAPVPAPAQPAATAPVAHHQSLLSGALQVAGAKTSSATHTANAVGKKEGSSGNFWQKARQKAAKMKLDTTCQLAGAERSHVARSAASAMHQCLTADDHTVTNLSKGIALMMNGEGGTQYIKDFKGAFKDFGGTHEQYQIVVKRLGASIPDHAKVLDDVAPAAPIAPVALAAPIAPVAPAAPIAPVAPAAPIAVQHPAVS